MREEHIHIGHVDAVPLAEASQGHEVPLEIAARHAQARADVGGGPDAPIESQGGHHLGPVRANRLAEVREGVRVGHRPEQVEIDRGLGQLGALVHHGQDRAAKPAQPRVERVRKRSGRVGRAHDDPLRLEESLDRVAEDERLDPVVHRDPRVGAERLDPLGESPGRAGRDLAHQHQGRAGAEVRDRRLD